MSGTWTNPDHLCPYNNTLTLHFSYLFPLSVSPICFTLSLVISLTKLSSLFFINKNQTNLHFCLQGVQTRPLTPAQCCQGSPAPHGAPGPPV